MSSAIDVLDYSIHVDHNNTIISNVSCLEKVVDRQLFDPLIRPEVPLGRGGGVYSYGELFVDRQLFHQILEEKKVVGRRLFLKIFYTLIEKCRSTTFFSSRNS